MKIIMYASVFLILFCNTLSLAGPAAHGGIPIGTQWEVEGANIFKNERTFVLIPARIGEVPGGVSRRAAGVIISAPFYAVAKTYQYISVAVTEAIFYSGIMNKYFRS